VLRKEKYKVKLFKSRISHIKFNDIIEYFPDIIGISVSTWNIKHVLELCTKIKQFIPEVKICVGGYAATFYSNEILRNTQEVDYIIRGEGEYAFLNLVRCLEKQEKLDSVKGLIYKEGQEIITNENQPFINNLDDLPFPSRDVLIDNHLNIASIESSRGCIGNCSYCSLKKFWIGQTENKKTTFREKTIMRVVDEIEDISKNLGISRFSFVDASYEINIL